MGDGWVLLFPEHIEKDALLVFLSQLVSAYLCEYQNNVEPLMQKEPRPIGLTLGIDTGDLIRLEMNEHIEYLGRALNVAARLQGEAKAMATDCSTTALFSKASFNSLKPEQSEYTATERSVQLKNITGGENFKCFAVDVL